MHVQGEERHPLGGEEWEGKGWVSGPSGSRDTQTSGGGARTRGLGANPSSSTSWCQPLCGASLSTPWFPTWKVSTPCGVAVRSAGLTICVR